MIELAIVAISIGIIALSFANAIPGAIGTVCALVAIGLVIVSAVRGEP